MPRRPKVWQIIAELRHYLLRMERRIRICHGAPNRGGSFIASKERVEEDKKDWQQITSLCGKLQTIALDQRSKSLRSATYLNQAYKHGDVSSAAALRTVRAILDPASSLPDLIKLLEQLWNGFDLQWQAKENIQGEEKEIFDSYSQAIALEREARLQEKRSVAANGLYKVFITQKQAPKSSKLDGDSRKSVFEWGQV